MRRNDVASTSFRRRVPIRFLINQCQIITFLIFKYDIIENSRIELRGIVLPVQMDGLLVGPKGMLAPPLKLLRGPGPPWPPLFLRLCVLQGGEQIYCSIPLLKQPFGLPNLVLLVKGSHY